MVIKQKVNTNLQKYFLKSEWNKRYLSIKNITIDFIYIYFFSEYTLSSSKSDLKLTFRECFKQEISQILYSNFHNRNITTYLKENYEKLSKNCKIFKKI